MELHQFFSAYANMPLADRMKAMDFSKTGMMTFDGAYRKIKQLTDQVRPLEIERDEIIAVFENSLAALKRANDKPLPTN